MSETIEYATKAQLVQIMGKSSSTIDNWISKAKKRFLEEYNRCIMQMPTSAKGKPKIMYHVEDIRKLFEKVSKREVKVSGRQVAKSYANVDLTINQERLAIAHAKKEARRKHTASYKHKDILTYTKKQQEQLVIETLEIYTQRDVDLNESAEEVGIPPAMFMKLLLNNEMFKRAFDEYHKTRILMEGAEMRHAIYKAFKHNLSVKDKVTTEVAYELMPNYGDDGNIKDYSRVPLREIERTQPAPKVSPSAMKEAAKTYEEILRLLNDEGFKSTGANIENRSVAELEQYYEHLLAMEKKETNLLEEGSE